MVSNTLTPRLKTLPEFVDAACKAAMMYQSGEAENWMKTNARWTDRTSNARNGLAARYAGSDGSKHVMVLFHQVPYGIWLEVRWEGKYAIIMPAVKEFGPRVMNTVQGILDKYPGGLHA
jgi:hypothetical protein